MKKTDKNTYSDFRKIAKLVDIEKVGNRLNNNIMDSINKLPAYNYSPRHNLLLAKKLLLSAAIVFAIAVIVLTFVFVRVDLQSILYLANKLLTTLSNYAYNIFYNIIYPFLVIVKKFSFELQFFYAVLILSLSSVLLFPEKVRQFIHSIK
ncbi:MAG: hypothetical protein PHP31_04400 [Lentimicrobiaceae bacterium]|nr:hypothetical protein [Lentimicrobiaceae bacterium]